jgi:hypothetical protein
MSNLLVRFKLRRDTAANWTEANPILAEGEMGYETDTNKMKIGNGTKAWKDLSYFSSSSDTAATFFDGGLPNTTYTSGPVFDLGGVN